MSRDKPDQENDLYGQISASTRIGGMSKKTAEAWDKPAPNKSKHTKLSPSSKRKAKASAKKVGRSRPSLVDNMNAAKAQKKKAGGKKSTAAKKSSPAKKPSED